MDVIPSPFHTPEMLRRIGWYTTMIMHGYNRVAFTTDVVHVEELIGEEWQGHRTQKRAFKRWLALHGGPQWMDRACVRQVGEQIYIVDLNSTVDIHEYPVY